LAIEARSPADVELWEREARGRFEHLRETRLKEGNGDPFAKGFWQASFVLLSEPRRVGLEDFLKRLRAAETNRTGWDIGWVPTRQGIAPYPYKEGIEVWLAEAGSKEPGHSDFWRAEPSGRFALFRGYQEDEKGFPTRTEGNALDFSLVLWRISELLLYIENFARQMEVPSSGATLKVTWTGLEGRILTYHKGFEFYEEHRCLQDCVTARYAVANASSIKRSLIQAVREITLPLFESFNFFSLSENQIKGHIKDLFDPDKELAAS
jgi:hypothetical protein